MDAPAVPPLKFRPPTNEELALVRKSWMYATPSDSKTSPDANGEKWIHIGSQLTDRGVLKKHHFDITLAGWHRAHAALRGEVLSSMSTIIVVAALASQPKEAVAWTAVEKSPTEWTVWWVHVIGEARGRGIGTALLNTIVDLAAEEGLGVTPGQMTPKARAWWKRVTETPR